MARIHSEGFEIHTPIVYRGRTATLEPIGKGKAKVTLDLRMKPRRIQRKRTKGWRMPPNYDMMASCRGQRGSTRTMLLVYLADLISQGNLEIAVSKGTKNTTRGVEKRTTFIEGKGEKKIHILVEDLPRKRGGNTQEKNIVNIKRPLLKNLAVSVGVDFATLEHYILITKMAEARRKETSMDGHI